MKEKQTKEIQATWKTIIHLCVVETIKTTHGL